MSSDNDGPMRGFRLAESCRNVVDEREECRSRETDRTETVLVMSQRQSLTKRRLDEALQNFHSRAKEADGTVGEAFICSFPGLEYCNDTRRLPNGQDLSICHRQIENRRQILNGPRANAFEMPWGQTIRANSSQVFRSFDRIHCVIERERGVTTIDRMGLIQFAKYQMRFPLNNGRGAYCQMNPSAIFLRVF